MKMQDILNITACLALFALAPLTRAQCPKSCDGNNTAIGSGALADDNSGLHNTAVGYSAGVSIASGSYNTAVGDTALGYQFVGCAQASHNTAVGAYALTTNSGANNTGIGANAMSLPGRGSDNTAIGEEAMFGNSGTFIQGSNIRPMDKASKAILSLKPVTFRYKKGLDPKAIPQFGLVAEQVEKVDPELVARDNEGKPYSVRYEAVNAMLLNEFLKEHRKVESLEQAIEEQDRQIKALTAGLQKVNDQIELSKPARTAMVNDSGETLSR
ncbi:MAG TPA: tail fiber domain-containing protein [Chthoniobacterales bacterium]|jgi:hypothetical protein